MGAERSTSSPGRGVAIARERSGFRSPQPSGTRRSFKEFQVVLLISAFISLGIGAFQLFSSSADGEDPAVDAILMLALSASCILAVLIGMRRSPKTQQYMWEAGDPLDSLADCRGVNTSLVVAIPVMIVVMVVVSAVMFSDIPPVVFAATGLLFLVAVVVGIARTRVMVQTDSILMGIPSGPMMLRLPYDKMFSVTLHGRFLKVVLTESPSPMSPKSVRCLMLGDVGPFAAAIQAAGMVQGVSIIVENVEIDSGLLRSCMDSIQQGKHEGDRTPDVGGEADMPFPGSKKPYYPAVISSLLFMAGVATSGFALVLVVLNDAITDSIGRHLIYLECCVILEFIFGALIIAGSILAGQRKKYNFVRTSAILAIISVGGFISTILGIISLVLLVKSKEDFEE